MGNIIEDAIVIGISAFILVAIPYGLIATLSILLPETEETKRDFLINCVSETQRTTKECLLIWEETKNDR